MEDGGGTDRYDELSPEDGLMLSDMEPEVLILTDGRDLQSEISRAIDSNAIRSRIPTSFSAEVVAFILDLSTKLGRRQSILKPTIWS